MGAFALHAPSVGYADIVWEGKVVAAWPEQESSRLYFAEPSFYRAPRGTVWGLTILVDFSDQPPAFTKEQVDAWLNEQGYKAGGLNGSVRDYFFDNSNGMVDFRNDVVGFHRARKTKSYYEGGSGYARSDELFAELMQDLDADIDFSKYDNDKDGRTDAISIVYAGPSVTWGQGLWPHASGSREVRDGVTISRYMMSNLGTQLTLYTFAHECGHMLFGWPDLYGFGDYCLMGNASNPRNPAGINDFYRADQGWIPVTTVTSTSNARYGAAAGTGGFRYVNPARPQELFFWSYVQNSARFSVLRGSGLLMMHFDKSIGVNNPPAKLGLAVVEADGRNDLGATMWPSPGSEADDFFRAGSEFSDTTTPIARWNDGTRTGLRVYDIAAAGFGVEFSVGTGMLPADAGVIGPPDAGGVDAGAPGGDGGASGGDGGAPATDAGAPMPGMDAGSSTGASTPGRDAATGDPGSMADAAPATGAPGADAAGPLHGSDAALSEAGTSPVTVGEGDDLSERDDVDGCAVKPGARRNPVAVLLAALALLGLRRRRRG